MVHSASTAKTVAKENIDNEQSGAGRELNRRGSCPFTVVVVPSTPG